MTGREEEMMGELGIGSTGCRRIRGDDAVWQGNSREIYTFGRRQARVFDDFVVIVDALQQGGYGLLQGVQTSQCRLRKTRKKRRNRGETVNQITHEIGRHSHLGCG